MRREDMKRRGDPGEVFDVQNMYQFVANSRLTGFRSRQDTPSRLHAFTPDASLMHFRPQNPPYREGEKIGFTSAPYQYQFHPSDSPSL